MMKPGDAVDGGGGDSLCETVQLQLSDYEAGLLLPVQARQVAAHLAACTACTQEAAFDHVFQLSVPRLPVATPPPALFEQIALATYAAPPRRTFREIILGYLAPPTTRLALGTAFAVGVATLIVPRFLVTPDSVPAPRQASVKVPPVKTAPPATAVSPRNIARVDVPPVKTPSLTVKSQPGTGMEAPTVEPTLPLPDSAPTVAIKPGRQIARINSPIKIAPSVTSKVRETAPAIASVNHSANTALRPAVRSITHTAPPPLKHTDPVIAEHVPAKNTSPDVPAPKTIEPDMTRATQVATAEMPEHPLMPKTSAESSNSGETFTPAAFSVTFRGANSSRSGGPRQILPSRSAKDVPISGSANVTIVNAPAKLD